MSDHIPVRYARLCFQWVQLQRCTWKHIQAKTMYLYAMWISLYFSDRFWISYKNPIKIILAQLQLDLTNHYQWRTIFLSTLWINSFTKFNVGKSPENLHQRKATLRLKLKIFLKIQYVSGVVATHKILLLIYNWHLHMETCERILVKVSRTIFSS